MVDYSKWDKFEISDDEDEEEDKPSVGVTRLQGSGRVTIDQRGVTIVDEPEQGQASVQRREAKDTPPVIGPTQPARLVSPGPAGGKAPKEADKQALATEMRRLLTENGQETESYLWSQTRSEVVLRIKLSVDAKGSQLDVKLVDGHLSVTRQGDRIFHRRLRYPIDTTDADDETNDWEVMDIPDLGEEHRYLCLTFRKRSAIPGASFWWNAVFEGDPEIDVTAIPGRNMAHADAWHEAQRLFQERVKVREPILVPIDDDDVSDDDGQGGGENEVDPESKTAV